MTSWRLLSSGMLWGLVRAHRGHPRPERRGVTVIVAGSSPAAVWPRSPAEWPPASGSVLLCSVGLIPCPDHRAFERVMVTWAYVQVPHKDGGSLDEDPDGKL